MKKIKIDKFTILEDYLNFLFNNCLENINIEKTRKYRKDSLSLIIDNKKPYTSSEFGIDIGNIFTNITFEYDAKIISLSQDNKNEIVLIDDFKNFDIWYIKISEKYEEDLIKKMSNIFDDTIKNIGKEKYRDFQILNIIKK